MAGSRKLEVQIVGDARSLERALGQSSSSANRFGGVMRKAGLAVAAGFALAVVGIEKSIKAAEAAEVSQAKLDTAFKNAGIAAGSYAKQVNEAEAAGRQFGFTNSETRDALGSLIGVAGSTTAAVKDLSIAQDFARFKQIDLATATKTLVSVMAGNARALKQVGLNIPAVTLAQDALKRGSMDLTTVQGRAALAQAKLTDQQATAQARMEKLTERIRGQASAYSETSAGAMSRFRATLNDLAEKIGMVLVPYMQRAVDQLSKWVNQLSQSEEAHRIMGALVKALGAAFSTLRDLLSGMNNLLQQNSTAGEALSAAFAGMLVSVLALGVALKAATAAQLALNIATETNPYVLAATAVIALGAALTVLYFRNEQVRQTMTKVAADVRGIVVPTIAFLEATWQRFGASLISVARANLLALTLGFRNAFDLIRGVVNIFAGLFTGDWSRMWSGIKQLWAGAFGNLIGVMRAYVSAFATVARQLGAAIVQGLGAGLAGLADKLGAFLGYVYNMLSGAAGYAYGLAKEIGKQILQGIWDGIKSAPGDLAGAIRDRVKKDVATAGKMARGSGDWHFTAHAIAEPMIEGIIEGLGKGQKDVKAKLKSILADPATIATLNNAANLVGKNAVTEMIKGLVGMTPSLQQQARQQARDMMEAWKQAALQKVADARSALSSAMGDMASAALAAFDAVSAQQTDAQKKLAKMQAEDAKKSVDDQVKAARDALAAAQAAASVTTVIAGETPEEAAARQKELNDAVIAAQGQLTAALRAQKEAELQVTIQGEQDKRAAKRQGLVDDLADLATWANQHANSHKQLLKRVEKIWKDYGIEGKKWGKNLGDAIADGLRAAKENVVAAARELAEAIKNNSKPGSPTKEGPLSTFDMRDAGYELGALYAAGIKASTRDIGAAFKGLTPAPSSGGGANTQLPPIIINLDGRQIAEVVEPHRFAMKRAGHALA